MGSAMILVLLLSAGIIALLVWFEINSRRNDARKKAKLVSAEVFPKDSQNTLAPTADKKKAA